MEKIVKAMPYRNYFPDFSLAIFGGWAKDVQPAQQ